MAIDYLPIVQEAGAIANATSVTVVMGSAPTSGNTLIGLVKAPGRGADSITQTGVTWTKIDGYNGNSWYIEFWLGAVGPGADVNAIATFTGSDLCLLQVFETTVAFTGTPGVRVTRTAASGNVNLGPLDTNAGDWVFCGVVHTHEAVLVSGMPSAPLTTTWGGFSIANSAGGTFTAWEYIYTATSWAACAEVIG